MPVSRLRQSVPAPLFPGAMPRTSSLRTCCHKVPLSVVSTSADQTGRTVTAKFLGIVERRASLLPNRGCVLDEDADPCPTVHRSTGEPGTLACGDAAVPPTQWGAGVSVTGLQQVVDQAFVGAGDPNSGNARGLAVVQDGKLLIQKQATGFRRTCHCSVGR